MTDISKKGKIIPKLPSNQFLFENWNREFCINFYDMYENKDFIKSKIIGWCPASKVFFEPKEDDRCLAIDIFRPEILKYFLIPFDEFQFLNYLGKSKTNINDLFKTEESNG